jgi:hypothetical protein
MKAYCTQNKGNCSTCALVSHGRDCRNKIIVPEDNDLSQFYGPGSKAREFPAGWVVYSEIELQAAISKALLANGARL